MAANHLESRIPPRAAGWSWQCGPELDPPKLVFSVRICPMDTRGPHVVSKALLLDVGNYWSIIKWTWNF
jgi:hypothetical protein